MKTKKKETMGTTISNIDRLSPMYKDYLLECLAKQDVDISQLKEYTWIQLEIMLFIDIGKRVRTGFDGEQCHTCGLVWRRKFAYDKCPRCGK